MSDIIGAAARTAGCGQARARGTARVRVRVRAGTVVRIECKVVQNRPFLRVIQKSPYISTAMY